MTTATEMLTISEAAHALNVSTDTLRRWEKKGLIHRPSRSNHNHRTFSKSELDQIAAKYSGQHKGVGFRVLKNRRPTNFSAVELFSGCGGLALGLEHAGIQAKLLVELDKDAVATLQANRKKWNVLLQDVRKVDFRPFAGDTDVVAGGFPCQAFSYAGEGRGFEDSRGTLFFDFARCVNEVRPKIFLAENVRGLVRHQNGETLRSMLSILRELGYRVAYRVVRSQFLDVPQKRERLIILGVRNDLDLPILFPKERNYTISVKEALTDCPPSEGARYPEHKRKVLELVPPGGYWRDLPPKIQAAYMAGSFKLAGGKTGMARRLSWEEPSLTLTCSPAQKQTERCHPAETRPLNVREYARIQTFPDEWTFSGSQASQYRQIGNAVPVNLGYHVGSAIRAMLTGEKMQEFEEATEHSGLADELPLFRKLA